MPIIKRLDTHTANLIAAGEVIERASSVVKELVENSIDAGATIINISLVDSGLVEINVSDNGSGMDSIDAKTCLEQHATSKIRDGNDLFRINSLGFRGEALPSIVSVSNFRIKTSTDGVKGVLLSLKAGALVSEAIIASPKGTDISVRNLFFNTPARLQNLSSQNIELSFIMDYVNRIALSKPGIAFKVINNDKLLLQTYGNNHLLEVIANVYDNDVAKNMLTIFEANSYYKVDGYISNLNVSRSSKNNITIIVNGRCVKSYKLINAVVEAYRERLVIGRYPICVINITVDPSLVDVNIHPAKLEVRFSSENDLIELLTHAIIYSLNNSDLLVQATKRSERIDLEEIDKNLYHEEDSEEEIIFKETNNTSPISNSNSNIFEEADFEEDFNEDIFIDEKLIKAEKDEVIQEKEESQESFSLVEEEDVIVDEVVSKYKLPLMSYIGQLHGTYLLYQDENHFYLIDQHAAYERINYEKIRKIFKKNNTESYELLVPLKLKFNSSDTYLINEKIDDLLKMGINLQEFGNGSYLAREIPTWIPKGVEIEFLEEIIYDIATKTKTDKYDYLESLAKSLSCKKSIKANQFLDNTASDYLLKDLGKCDNPYNCPHGRPVIVKLPITDIEKWFKRIV